MDKFTSPITRIFLFVIMVDLMVISSFIIPIIPVNSSEIMFELSDYSLQDNEYTYRWFDLEKGNRIHIDYWCSQNVDTYIFTEFQFLEYAASGNDGSLDSTNKLQTGTLKTNVKTSGTYFFLIRNSNESQTEVIYSQGTGSSITRITVAQKIKSHWFNAALNNANPFSRMARENPGVGSNI